VPYVPIWQKPESCDIDSIVKLMKSGALLKAVEAEVGELV
jgi:hypothetical protein